MKTKLFLLAMLMTITSVNAQVTDFVTEQVGHANQIVLHNNTLYFTTEVYNPNTWEYAYYIKKIDLSASTPTASVLYGPLPDNKSIWDLAVLDNTLYTVIYNEDTNRSIFSSFNLSQTTPALTEHLTIYGYVQCIAINNGYLYYTQTNIGNPHLERRNISFSGDSEYIVSLGLGSTKDMHFDGNILYLTTQGIKTIDVSQTTSTLTTLKTGNFFEGIHIAGGYVWYSDTGILKKFPISNPDDVTTFTTDSLWIMDLVNDGQNIYATASNKIVQITDETLSTNPFLPENRDILIYPNPVSETLNFSQDLKEITIYDFTGKIIKSFTGNQDKIDVSTLSNRNYILKGKTESGERFNVKFVKN